MQFDYTKIPSTNSAYPFFLHPLLDIRLHRGSASYPLRGHLDTGADQTLMHKDIADALYIDWKSGIKSFTRGITGGMVPIYIHELELEIVAFPGVKIRSSIGFIGSGNVGVLLGQLGFFEHYKITFERYQSIFHIEPKP